MSTLNRIKTLTLKVAKGSALTASLFLFSLTASAQQSRKDIKENILLSGSNYVAYYGPQKQLTEAPKGYKPFYISHYGRHGSRYLIGTRDYDRPCEILSKAAEAGALTKKGKETLQKCEMIREEARLRDGELTLRGAEQHRQIAHRMYERFPEVFAGKTRVDAKSTVVIRCILSMENALQELRSLNPEIETRHDASAHDMWYMNFDDKELGKMKMTEEGWRKYNEFCEPLNHPQHLMKQLFKDDKYVKENVDAQKLMDNLWKLACNLQSTELRHQISLYDLFTDDDIYDQWQKQNAYWYIGYANSPLSGNAQQFSQRNLLRVMINEADSCVKLPHPGATLRYGHEVCVMPLVALLDLNGYGASIDDLSKLDDRGWLNYRIYPMGCNVQIIFYTNAKSGATPKEDDILIKVLLNEDEATLPIKPYKKCYYKWTDFRKYFLNKLDNYNKK